MGNVDWDMVNSFVLPAITKSRDFVDVTCAFDNDRIIPPGPPRKKGTYASF